MPVSIIPYIYFFCNRFSGKLLNLIKQNEISLRKMCMFNKKVAAHFAPPLNRLSYGRDQNTNCKQLFIFCDFCVAVVL